MNISRDRSSDKTAGSVSCQKTENINVSVEVNT